MAFWSDTTLDPKRAFKFKVTFTSRLGQNMSYLAQSADRPQYTISDGTKVDFLDKAFHFPGKITWEPVKIKFVDAGSADTNVSKDSYDYLKKAGWVNPKLFSVAAPAGADASFGTISKNAATRVTGDINVQVLSSTGQPIDSWSLKNAFISKASLNGLAYASEDILTAEYTIRYDWAELT
jgi:hypothetical protein